MLQKSLKEASFFHVPVGRVFRIAVTLFRVNRGNREVQPVKFESFEGINGPVQFDVNRCQHEFTFEREDD